MIKNIVFILLAFLSITPYAYGATSESTVFIAMPFDNGHSVINMTGFVLRDSMDENGNRYILTARHGIKGENNQGFQSIQGIAIYDWQKDFLGYANVAYCDPVWGSRGENAQHDFCLLKIVHPEAIYSTIDGYEINENLPASGSQICFSGLSSWTHGSSGSPLIVNGGVIGLLSMTYNENKESYDDWILSYKDKNLLIPSKMVKTPDQDKMVLASCGFFPSFSPELLAYLKDSTQNVRYIDSTPPEGIPYQTFGFPDDYRVQISGNF